MTSAQSNKPAKTEKAGTGVATRPYEKLQANLIGRARLDGSAVDGFEIASSVVDKIATAETLDELFDAQAAGAGLDTLIGQPLNVTDVSFAVSDEKYTKNGGLGAYVRMTGITDNGEMFNVATGATNVVAFMYRASEKGFIQEDKPCRVKILARDTANGTLYTVGKP